MKLTINGDFKNEIVKTPKQKNKLSAGAISESLKDKSEFKNLLKILEPREIPVGFKI